MISPLAAALVASSLVPSALAFVNTAPFVLWSSSPASSVVESLSTAGAIVDSSSAYDVLRDSLLCELEAVLVIDQEGLHATDLPSMSLPSSTLQLSYLTSTSPSLLDEALAELARTCGSVVEARKVGESLSKETKEGAVRIVKLQSKAEEDRDAEDSLLKPFLTTFLASHPFSHLVVLTGHPSSLDSSPPAFAVQRRQETPLLVSASSAQASHSAIPAPLNGSANVESNIPLLARYQLLSTPIITCLIVAFGLLMPILALGISALNSIQVPSRMTATKGIIVTGEKKNQ